MTNYGFLIDQSKCIGCHACSTACKSENQVPLGVYRTWVKYVETGAYPDVRRRFQVTRCNHCANPPCVRICPVSAMYQRSDGIVEFDPSICIGCKSCMQACPYDSIYLDPETNTAAKCHFCAHRLDVGLEPACVVVCPEHAILAGDLNDPASEISRKLGTAQATVRKPEQGTGPKLFYINGNDWSLHPTAASASDSFLWADKITEQNTSTYELPVFPASTKISKSGTPIRPLQEQGRPLNGPIQIGGRVAEHMVQTAYNAQHKIHWHWELPTYLITKGIAGGLFMLLSVLTAYGFIAPGSGFFLKVGFTSLLFMLITVILLIKDLSQPKRFLNILLHPQWKSWVARGAFILVGFTAVSGLWWLLEGAVYLNLLPGKITNVLHPFISWITLVLAIGTVVYTAFLLGQAEGRDMWQSSLLPFQLIAQSLMVSLGVLSFLTANDNMVYLSIDFNDAFQSLFYISIVVNLVLTLAGKFAMPYASEVAQLASREMTQGRFRIHFWLGGILLGHILPLIFLFVNNHFWAGPNILEILTGLLINPIALPLATISTIVGLFFYEYAFVMAPQHIPNS